MAGNELPWSSAVVKLSETSSASTGILDARVRFVRKLKIAPYSSMRDGVFGSRTMNLEILRRVVSLVSVEMMNLLALEKPAPYRLLGNEPMLVGVSSYIGKVMCGSYSDENVTVRGD